MSSAAVDADFAEDVLADLYAYPLRRRRVAYLLWGTLGWFGAHRYYLDRTGTGLLMTFTLGGGLVWWLTDLFLIPSMVAEFNRDQERRRREGLPPAELSFMPPLHRDVLAQPPEWTHRWRTATRRSRMMRFAGDLLVLVTSGFLLGVIGRSAEVWEAVLAVIVLVALASAGTVLGRFSHVPVMEGLIRWNHRLRLFYYYSTPGTPIALLFRPVTGALLAPFRRRDRAEVKLYLQLGGVFTLFFMVLDFGGAVLGPLFDGRLPAIGDLLGLWVQEAIVTFVVIYAFATPVGAVLTLYLLVRRTHTVPRILSGLTLAAVLAGLLA